MLTIATKEFVKKKKNELEHKTKCTSFSGKSSCSKKNVQINIFRILMIDIPEDPECMQYYRNNVFN